MVDGGPWAERTSSDGLEVYRGLIYAGEHVISEGKEETYTVEGINADLRHYLARLARRSRCFSRSIRALGQAIKLFVHYFNCRCLKRLAYPAYAQTMPLVPGTP